MPKEFPKGKDLKEPTMHGHCSGHADSLEKYGD